MTMQSSPLSAPIPNLSGSSIESPTNPTLRLVDIPRIICLAKSHPSGPLALVDNTFLSPFYSSLGAIQLSTLTSARTSPSGTAPSSISISVLPRASPTLPSICWTRCRRVGAWCQPNHRTPLRHHDPHTSISPRTGTSTPSPLPSNLFTSPPSSTPRTSRPSRTWAEPRVSWPVSALIPTADLTPQALRSFQPLVDTVLGGLLFLDGKLPRFYFLFGPPQSDATFANRCDSICLMVTWAVLRTSWSNYVITCRPGPNQIAEPTSGSSPERPWIRPGGHTRR